MHGSLAPAHWMGLAALAAALGLAFLDPRLAALPLLLFVLACLAAPMFPTSSFHFPIVCRGQRGSEGVALTFDDGPDPQVTPQVLDLLDRHDAKAAFFVIGAKAERHPELVRAILERGHQVGNHSHTHPPLLMLQGRRAIAREVDAGQAALAALGAAPLAFRPPVGVSHPELGRILLERNLFCLNFSCRAGDLGNRRVAGIARRLLAKVRPGDIILLHDRAPQRASVAELLDQFEQLLAGLRRRGLAVQPLPALLGRPVMAATAPRNPGDPTA